MKYPRIYLTGFMGSGKSYFGRWLAAQTNWHWLDLDHWIEMQEGRSVRDIFESAGEQFFREKERHYLHQTSNIQSPLICSTGGGAPCFFDNMDWMRDHGATVYLKTDIEVLVKRLLPERDQRPLLAGIPESELADFLEKKIAGRAPFYEQARHVIIQNGNNDAEVQVALLDIAASCSDNSATEISR